MKRTQLTSSSSAGARSSGPVWAGAFDKPLGAARSLLRPLAVAILCLLAMWPAMALAQEKGIIQGAVNNGTSGGGSVEGLEIALHVFQGQEESETLATSTDAQGQFRFQGLQLGSEWVYLARVSYQGVTYSSGLLTFETGQSELAIELAVYETTIDDKSISVERAHIFVVASGSGIAVSELYVFANSGDRTYLGKEELQGRRATSSFLLPQQSYNLALDDGALRGRFLSTEGGFVDTEPHWPGTTQVMFSYSLDCGADGCDLSRVVLHPIANLNVLIADSGVWVDSKTLTFEGRGEAEGQTYLNYVGRNLASGDRLDFAVGLGPAGPVQTVSARSSSTYLPWIILGGVPSGLVLVYPFWRRRVRAAAIEEYKSSIKS